MKKASLAVTVIALFMFVLAACASPVDVARDVLGTGAAAADAADEQAERERERERESSEAEQATETAEDGTLRPEDYFGTIPAATAPAEATPPAEPAEEETSVDGLSVYVCYSDQYNDEYAPRITMAHDGSFEFEVNLYEGMGLIRGDFRLEGDTALMTVTERDFSGFVGDDVNSFSFAVDGDTLIYQGSTIGATNSGDRFTMV